ncbi:MAG: phasin family protein [Magnetospirillum sp. WYHS-4]
MAKASNPFFGIDMTKFAAEFDPAKMTEEFTKMAGQYQVPGVDMNAVIDSQRKNLEAVTQANRVALEGMQAFAKRQAEILQQTLGETVAAVESLTGSGTPQEATAKQADLVKTAYEKALANMKELAELVAKSNAEAGETINKRIAESLDEIKKAALDIKKKK